MAGTPGFRMTYTRLLTRLLRAEQQMSGGSLQRIGEFARTRVFQDSQQSFVLQADPTTGTAWRPSLRAKKQHGQTLLDTGRLRRAVRATSRVEGRRVVVQGGTLPLAYAAIHQFGGTVHVAPHSRLTAQARVAKGPRRGQFKRGAGTGHGFTFGARTIEMPARPYVGLRPQSAERIRVFAASEVSRAVTG